MLTDSSKIAKRIKTIRRHGKDKDFSMLGYNSRMYVLNAEIINPKIKICRTQQKTRQKMLELIMKHLQVCHCSARNVKWLESQLSKYVIRLLDKNTRKRVKDALGASIHYETSLSANSMYESLHSRRDACTQSRQHQILFYPYHSCVAY